MAEIDAWVLRTACEEATGWPAHIQVSVNLSPSSFYRSGLVESILSVLVETGLLAARLELKVTEMTMSVDADAAAAVICALRAAGVSIALDDFGTGCSSLVARRPAHLAVRPHQDRPFPPKESRRHV